MCVCMYVCTYNYSAFLSSSVCPQGTLIQHLKEHILHGNMCGRDVIFYYTTVSDATTPSHHTFTPHLLTTMPYSPCPHACMFIHALNICALSHTATPPLAHSCAHTYTPSITHSHPCTLGLSHRPTDRLDDVELACFIAGSGCHCGSL